MTRCLALAVAVALSGSSQASNADAPRDVEKKGMSVLIPFDKSKGFLDGYLLRVSRHGDFLWNGAPITEEVLKKYLHQYSAIPHGAGRIFVAFEPKTPQTRVESVRRQIIDSGLCEQHRCAEVGWNVKRPIVN